MDHSPPGGAGFNLDAVILLLIGVAVAVLLLPEREPVQEQPARSARRSRSDGPIVVERHYVHGRRKRRAAPAATAPAPAAVPAGDSAPADPSSPEPPEAT